MTQPAAPSSVADPAAAVALPLWLSVALLIGAIGVVGTNALLLSPLVQAVGSDLGVSIARVMQAAGAYGLGVAGSALVFAPLGDRIGAGRLLQIACGVLTLGFVASALAPAMIWLMLAQVLCGLAGGAALPSIYTLAAVIAPKGREARIVGAVLTGWTLALVLGVSLGAFVADLWGWRAVYGGLGLMTMGIGLGLTPMTRHTGGETGQSSSPLTALRVPGMRRGIFATFCLMLGFYLTYSFTGAHVTVQLGLSTTMAGLVPLAYGLGFGSAVLLDSWLDRLGLARATPPVFLACALSYVGLALMGQMAGVFGFALYLGVSFVWGIFQHLALNLLVARLTALDPRQRGAIMGLYSATTYLCVFAAPLLGGGLFAGFGFTACALVSALLLAAETLEARSLRKSLHQNHL